MITEDQRTPEQKETHFLAIVAKDKFMSGWGAASRGISRVAYSFDRKEVNHHRVFDWVKARPEMSCVSLVDLRTYRPKNTAHLQIYVIDKDHKAAKF